MILHSKAAEKPVFAIVVVLFILAFLSRFYGIWIWDLVGDERFTAFHSYKRYKSIINPAYYFLVVASYNIFGSSEWIARVPAFLFGVASIPVMYVSWARVVGRNVAFFAALVLIFSAWHLWFSQYARFYIGVFFFSSLAYFSFFRAIHADKISYLVWGLFFSLMAILFHVTAVFVPISCGVAYLALLIFRNSIASFSIRVAKVYLLICLVTALGAVPVLLNVLESWVSRGQTWGYGSVLIIPQVVKYIQLPIAVSAFFGWILLLKRWPTAAIFFGAGIGVPLLFIILAASSISVRPDYVFYILPLMIVLSGVACEEVRDALDKGKSKIMPFFAVFLVISTLMPEFASHYLGKKSLRFEQVVTFVENNFRQDDQVLSFVKRLELDVEGDYHLLPFISFERDSSVKWGNALKPLLETDRRTWIIISSKRQSLAVELENWLLCNASLVWRKHAVRLDYEVDGYQIFLVPGSNEKSYELNGCNLGLEK